MVTLDDHQLSWKTHNQLKTKNVGQRPSAPSAAPSQCGHVVPFARETKEWLLVGNLKHH
ncbi:MAG: hypothetical protein DHS20C07_17820 [Methyloligella sp.]|nr:MAG: hypothetical protein DHS20C07_17820 [Methyloligella sp.]